MTGKIWQFLLFSAWAVEWGVASCLAQRVLKPLAPQFTPDPQVYEGTTEGEVSMQSLLGSAKGAGNCPGVAGASPNHSLTLQKPMSSLSVRVTASAPVTILVRGKDGVRCRSGMNPEIMGAWSEGNYDIWVGSVKGDRVNYRLSLSEGRQSP